MMPKENIYPCPFLANIFGFEWITHIDFSGIGPRPTRPNLRSHVKGGADASGFVTTSSTESLTGRSIRCELPGDSKPKIANLDIGRVFGASAYEDVFRFQVTVDDSEVMDVGETTASSQTSTTSSTGATR
jgi:hypothetical protein